MILIKREKERKSFSWQKNCVSYASNFFVGGEKVGKLGDSTLFSVDVSLDKTPFAQHYYTEFFEGAIRELSKMLNRMNRNLNIINILFITCS